MLSGLFRRKDKKNKSVDEEIDEMSSNGEKRSAESSRASPVSDGGDTRSQTPPSNLQMSSNLQGTKTTTITTTTTTTKESPNKLQKKPRNETSPPNSRSGSVSRERSPRPVQAIAAAATQSPAHRGERSPTRVEDGMGAEHDRRNRSDSSGLMTMEPTTAAQQAPVMAERNHDQAGQSRNDRPATTIRAVPSLEKDFYQQHHHHQAKAETLGATDHQRQIQDDGVDDGIERVIPVHGETVKMVPSEGETPHGPTTSDRLSESPVEVDRSMIKGGEGGFSKSPGRLSMDDNPSGEVEGAGGSSTVMASSEPGSSPEMVDSPEVTGSSSRAPDEEEIGRARTPSTSSTTTSTGSTTTTASTAALGAAEAGAEAGAAATTTAPVWNDASLRTYLDDDNDIRDLLIVVHDKSGVVPAGPDHPIVGKLFKEENARLAELSTVRFNFICLSWLFISRCFHLVIWGRGRRKKIKQMKTFTY